MLGVIALGLGFNFDSTIWCLSNRDDGRVEQDSRFVQLAVYVFWNGCKTTFVLSEMKDIAVVDQSELFNDIVKNTGLLGCITKLKINIKPLNNLIQASLRLLPLVFFKRTSYADVRTLWLLIKKLYLLLSHLFIYFIELFHSFVSLIRQVCASIATSKWILFVLDPLKV